MSSIKENLSTHKTELYSFVNFRWFSFVGQLLVLIVAKIVFDLSIPWISILTIILLIPVTNLLSTYVFNKNSLRGNNLCGLLLVVDTFLLTGVLYFAGGPTNPFTILYLLQVVLSAILLTTSWTWAIATLTTCCFASLYFFSQPVPEWQHHGAHHGFSLHLHGMLFAYIIVCTLVGYFLNKIVSKLREKDKELEKLKGIAQSHQRIASLAALSASTAHELGTPLGTISLIAHELELSLEKDSNLNDEIKEDLKLLKAETQRCKEIMNELSQKSADPLGETNLDIKFKDLINDVLLPLSVYGVNFEIKADKDLIIKNIPVKALTLALRSLIKNSIEATLEADKQTIIISARKLENKIEIEIRDFGVAQQTKHLKRIGEPFFSTKENGMGLGVYLAKVTLNQLAGDVTYRVEDDKGVTTVITWSAELQLGGWQTTET